VHLPIHTELPVKHWAQKQIPVLQNQTFKPYLNLDDSFMFMKVKIAFKHFQGNVTKVLKAIMENGFQQCLKLLQRSYNVCLKLEGKVATHIDS
jgi:hypothetical protein